MFNPKQSKYSLSREEQNKLIKEKRKDAPTYLKDQRQYEDFIQKDFEMKNPELLK